MNRTKLLPFFSRLVTLLDMWAKYTKTVFDCIYCFLALQKWLALKDFSFSSSSVYFDKTCPHKYDCVNISQLLFWLCASTIWCHVVLLRWLINAGDSHKFLPIMSGASIWICMTRHETTRGQTNVGPVCISTKDCCSSCFP